MLPHCDIVFGSRRDLTDLLGMTVNPALDSSEQFRELVRDFMDQYSIEQFAGTFRTRNDGKSYLCGFLFAGGEYQQTEPREIINLDRIGAGDGYAAGVLLGYAEKWPLARTVDFAAANGVLAHTIQGDVPLTTRKQVEHMMKYPTVDLIR